MRRYGWITAAIFGALVTSAAGCGGGDQADSDGLLKVVATTGQVGEVVARVGGDRVKVTSLMGPGVDPHLYKASAGDVDRLRNADLIAYNGLHLESKMSEVLHRLDERQPTLAVAEAVPEDALLAPPEFAGAHDPHVWFDVALWSRTAGAVCDKLSEIDPEHAADYRKRADDYEQELAQLDEWIRLQIVLIPEDKRVLITAHDAFNYLGRAYGLDVRGLQGISTATEAGTADVQDLAAFIAEREIPAIFVETSVSPRAIEAVQAAVRSRGFQVVVGGELHSDSLGDPGTPAGTYEGMVRHNVRTIVAALSGEAHDH